MDRFISYFLRHRFLLLLFFIQAILCGIAFYPFILNPTTCLLGASGDGIKNYYTLYSYIIQPQSYGYWKYSMMNYPYGDVIFFTDNTPLVAIILRWIHLNILDIESYIFFLYNSVFIGCCFLAVFPAYFIICRYTSNRTYALIGSILVCWTTPQILRFSGHLNLSISLFFLLLIWLQIKQFEIKEKGFKYHVFYFFSIQVLLIISSFFHLYYLALIGFPILFFYALGVFIHSAKKQFLFGVIGTIITMFFCKWMVQIHDVYAALRLPTPQGYDWSEWKANPADLFQSMEGLQFFKFGFTDRSTAWGERAVYFGNFFWYGFVLFVCALLFLYLFKKVRPAFNRKQELFLFSSVALISLSISLGNYVEIKHVISFSNVFNPFFWIQKIYPSIMQFRCLSRFMWYAFYVFNVVLFVVLIRLSEKHRLVKFSFWIILFIGFTDVYGFITYVSNHIEEQRFFSINTPTFSSKEYEAILPIPFYTVGSENYDITTDDVHDFSYYVYRISLTNKIPQTSVKLSRTPPIFSARHLLTLCTAEKGDIPYHKKILVIWNPIVNKIKSERKYAKYAQAQEDLFVQKAKLTYLCSDGENEFYSWNPNQ